MGGMGDGRSEEWEEGRGGGVRSRRRGGVGE